MITASSKERLSLSDNCSLQLLTACLVLTGLLSSVQQDLYTSTYEIRPERTAQLFHLIVDTLKNRNRCFSVFSITWIFFKLTDRCSLCFAQLFSLNCTIVVKRRRCQIYICIVVIEKLLKRTSTNLNANKKLPSDHKSFNNDAEINAHTIT